MTNNPTATGFIILIAFVASVMFFDIFAALVAFVIFAATLVTNPAFSFVFMCVSVFVFALITTFTAKEKLNLRSSTGILFVQIFLWTMANLIALHLGATPIGVFALFVAVTLPLLFLAHETNTHLRKEAIAGRGGTVHC
ncbi:MAG: hypothetical protein Q8R36_05030 [bacterium]|nr:hypothetical protein [bacterium]